eukprot:1449354-Amphidinium_carterae.1
MQTPVFTALAEWLRAVKTSLVCVQAMKPRSFQNQLNMSALNFKMRVDQGMIHLLAHRAYSPNRNDYIT